MVTNFFEKWAHKVILLWGWKKATCAFIAGALLTLSFEPFNLWPVLFISLPMAIWLLDGLVATGGWRHGKGILPAFITGWWFGFGFFLSGLWWIGNAFLVDADQFIYFLPLAVVGLPMFLALFYGAAFAFASTLWSTGVLRIFTFASSIALFEFIRGNVLTGFPWNTIGYAFSYSLELSQLASVVGIWGLTWIALFVGSSIATLAATDMGFRSKSIPILALIIVIAQFSYGLVRLSKSEPQFVPGVRFRIVQPNIQQDSKFKPEAKDEILASYQKLSNMIGENGIQLKEISHLIWPESALPVILEKDINILVKVSQMLPLGVTLLTGAVRIEEGSGVDKANKYYNSILAINEQSEIVASYNKKHLVPFGEYLPFQDELESLGLKQLTQLRGGFSEGKKQKSMSIPRAPLAGPLICYEAIFPGHVINDDDRPQWLLNVTNDGWFGQSIGPHQHLMQAKMRSIEEGLPLVRAANTGISVVTDSYGRIIRSLPLGKEGILDSPLPKSISKTPYFTYRNISFYSILGFSLLISFMYSRREPR